jgi:UDP-glucose 4-epimerase
MAKVLITGITGRVGTNLAVALQKKGYEIRGMVMPNDPASNKLTLLHDVEVVYTPLTDQDGIFKAVEGVDYVMHMAAQMVKGDTPAERFFDINAMGTMRLLEAASKAKHPITRFVLASTDATYPATRPHYNPMDENHPQTPGDYYGASKLLCENLVKSYSMQYKLPYTIVRFGSVQAADEVLRWFRYSFMVGFFRLAERGRDIHLWPIFEGYDRPWEYLEKAVPDKELDPAVGIVTQDGRPWGIHLSDVRDTVDGAILAMEHPAALGEAFNIVGPATVTYDVGARVISDRFKLPLHIVKVPMYWYFDVSSAKAQKLLGFKPQWTFEKMVDSALAYQEGASIGVIPTEIGKIREFL